MYIAYLDASGRISKKDRENYVLSSVIIHESQWGYIDNELNKIKKKHFPDLNHEIVEIHAKDMLNRSGIFKDWLWKPLYDLFDDVFKFIIEKLTPILRVRTFRYNYP
jgi:hypothetical protein